MSLVDIVSSNKFAQWTAASIIVTAAALLLSRDAAAQDTSSGQRLFQDKADCQILPWHRWRRAGRSAITGSATNSL